jgi:DNA-binding Lrp family transcriptional regulator
MDSVIGNGTEKLDKIDLFIIEAMREDGREAFAQIAEKLNVSPGMIRQRYNRLVKLGYLKVVAVTNPLMMGKRTMAMIGSAPMDAGCLKWRTSSSSLTRSFTSWSSAADMTSWSKYFAATMKTCSSS